MTIGYILDDSLDRSDGVQQAMLAIGEHMRELGHDVHYIVTETKRTDIKNVHSVGSYYSMKFNGNSVRTPKPVSRRRIKQLFDAVQFDVLHVQMPYSPFFAARVLAAAPPHVRKVGTFHILPYSVLSRVGTRLLGISLRRSVRSLNACYAVSEPARVFMEQTLKVSGKVLPNPIDYELYRSAKRQKSSKKQIVYIGRFEERKGVRELLDAYAGLTADVRSQTELTMISKGPLFEEIRSEAVRHQLGINFPGFVSEEEKIQYLANASIAVFPSTSGESFGIVLVEAMAAGSDVTIGGNNPGYASVLGQWPEALFNPKDTAEFSQKLTQFLTDNELTERIGSQQHTAAKQYDVAIISQELLDNAYAERT